MDTACPLDFKIKTKKKKTHVLGTVIGGLATPQSLLRTTKTIVDAF